MDVASKLAREVKEQLRDVGDIKQICCQVQEIFTNITDDQFVEKEAETLLSLLLYLAKEKYKRNEAEDIIKQTSGDSKAVTEILTCYEKLVKRMTVNKPKALNKIHFKKLDWRFQITVATRALLKTTEVKFLLKLTLENRFKEEEMAILFEADVKTLQSLVDTIAQAMAEANTPQARKLTKRFIQ